MSNKKGMSLVEIMLGVILLTLIIVPALNVINSKSKAVTATRDHSQAAFIAQKIQETARAFRFDLLDADQYAGDEITRKKTFEWKTQNLEQYRVHNLNGIKYEITDLKIEPASIKNDPDSIKYPILYLIEFNISYTGKDSRTHNLRINTALSKRD